MQQRLFVKRFSSKKAFDNEVHGYDFIFEYFDNVPKRQSIDSSGLTIQYEFISTAQRLTDLLRKNYYPPEMTSFWQKQAKLHKKNLSLRKSNGGSKLFYQNRSYLLENKYLITNYEIFTNKYPHIKVDGKLIKIDPNLIQSSVSKSSLFMQGLCIPSQGDMHERNIFSNGCFVDFEASNWNLLFTDIATTLWHTIVAGNHFGPKYADWASQDTLTENFEPTIKLDNDAISLNLNAARLAMIKDYKNNYLAFFDYQKLIDVISMAMTYRCLTMFRPYSMTLEDQVIIFSLANYFRNPNNLLLMLRSY